MKKHRREWKMLMGWNVLNTRNLIFIYFKFILRFLSLQCVPWRGVRNTLYFPETKSFMEREYYLYNLLKQLWNKLNLFVFRVEGLVDTFPDLSKSFFFSFPWIRHMEDFLIRFVDNSTDIKNSSTVIFRHYQQNEPGFYNFPLDRL